MKHLIGVRFAWCTLGVLFGVMMGCTSSTPSNDTYSKVAQRFLTSSASPDATSIAEALPKAVDGQKVSILAKISAGTFDPWDEGKATFVISEAIEDTGSHSHGSEEGHEDCPFCKAKSVKAIVQFLEDDGTIIPVDARKLFGLKKDQRVIVQGSAKMNELDMLVVSAESLHLPQR